MRDNESCNNEYCQFVQILIPRYIKSKCTESEAMLIREHCAGCQECLEKLFQAIEENQRTSMEEVLYLTRPRNLEVFTEPDREEEIRKINISTSGKAVPEYAALLIIDAANKVIDASTALRDIVMNNLTDVHQHVSFVNTQSKKLKPLVKNISAGLEADFPIDWKDKALEAGMREITGISSGSIRHSDVSHITKLDMSNKQISNISALANLRNLKELDLNCNTISDISALANLRYLAKLDLSWNKISDISVLRNLTNLTCLDLSGNQISDISALYNLTNLMYLILNRNKISDIRVLRDLTNLTMLDLNRNKISDISPLGNLINLTLLNIGKNPITDYSPIEGLDINKLYK